MTVMGSSSGAAGSPGFAAGFEHGPSAMRRVMWRLVPFLMITYFVGFLDRVNVAFAAIQMNKDLAFSPGIYGFGAGLFFITYCVFEVPSNLALYKFGPTRWLARIMITWGLIAAAMAFVVGPYSFYAMRLLLGAAEAGFFPGILFFLTLWFPSAYRGRVLGFFMASAALSGLIGSPVSGLLLQLEGAAGLHGWQWLFIMEGVPAVILAPFCLFYLQDNPAKAAWLPADERQWLTTTLESERREREARKQPASARALLEPGVLFRVLFMAVMYFTNVCLLNGITFFLPLMLKGFGLSNVQTGFVAAIPSAFAVVCVILWGRYSDKGQDRYRDAALANCVAGAALLVSTLIPDPTTRVVLITVAMGGTLAFTPPFWSIPATFLSGAASAGGYAAISSLGVLGGFAAPSVIGWLGNVSGDFRVGLGIVGVAAIVMSVAFYLVGRTQGAAAMLDVSGVRAR